MNKASKKVLKSLFSTYGPAGLLLLMALLSAWEYKTKGFISAKGYRFYGEEGRTIAWLTLLVASGGFIYYTILSFIKLRNAQARKQYVTEIDEEPKYLICLRCCKPFLNEQTGKNPSCPLCKGTEIEELSGFFERHPEKKAKCPSIELSDENRAALRRYEVHFAIMFGVMAAALGIFFFMGY